MLSRPVIARARRFLGRAWFSPRFSGVWADRLSGLFDCDVSYTDKTLLDVGSNMGIIAYEIAKQRPAFIHGIDRYRRAVVISQRLFLAVDVPHRFDVVDLFAERRLKTILRPDYDLVLFLAIWQHIVRADRKRSLALLDRLTAVCREALLFRGPDATAADFTSAMADRGFELAFRSERTTIEAGPIHVFRRVARAGPSSA